MRTTPWRIAQGVCFALALICLNQMARVMDGAHIAHALGWFEGFGSSIGSFWFCAVAAMDRENHDA